MLENEGHDPATREAALCTAARIASELVCGVARYAAQGLLYWGYTPSDYGV